MNATRTLVRAFTRRLSTTTREVYRRPPNSRYIEPRQTTADAAGRAEVRWSGPPAGCERIIERTVVSGGNPATVQPVFYLYSESPANILEVAPSADVNTNDSTVPGCNVAIPTGADVVCVWNGLVVGTVVTATLWGVTRGMG